MDFTEKCNRIFWNTTQLYHQFDDIDAEVDNPFEEGSVENMLFRKNWIDAVQWHMEDICVSELIGKKLIEMLPVRVNTARTSSTTATTHNATAPMRSPVAFPVSGAFLIVGFVPAAPSALTILCFFPVCFCSAMLDFPLNFLFQQIHQQAA